MKRGAKHKLCRRVGSCVWGNAKCPSTKRPYPAGEHGNDRRRRKLSTYGELLLEKQKLRTHYDLTEKQLRLVYRNAVAGSGATGDKLIRLLELRLASVVYRGGLAPTIFAAKQAVSHRHIKINGKIVDRSSCLVKPGDAVAIDAHRSPSLAAIAKDIDIVVPDYLELDKDNTKIAVKREPLPEEIPVPVEIMRVVEFYAR